MHYCFFSVGDWEFNASLVRTRMLGEQLLKRGIRVSYLVDDLPFNRRKLQLPDGAGAEFVTPTTGFKQFAARREILRRIHPDYVHVLNPAPKAYLTFRGLPDQKLVIDFDEWFSEKIPRTKPWHWVQSGLERRLCGRAVKVVVASQYMRDEFARRFGLDALYLPYATYLNPQPHLPSPFSQPTAVYMGNLMPEYDHDLLFAALVLLKQRGIQPPVEFLGGGPLLESCRRFVKEQGLEQVKVAGFVTGDDLWARLRHAHVLLFPIRPSPGNLARCPSKTYAYAQARRPIIACRVGEVPSVLGERAVYVEPNAGAFADALAEAFGRPQPDVDYGIEGHDWGERAGTLLEALGE